MPKSAKRAGEINGYWLSQRPGSAMWYRTWFDAETRQTRRVSLGTDDFESAGLALAIWVAANAKPRDADPREVTLAGVFVRYHESLGSRHPGAASQFVSLRMIDRVVQPCLSVAEFTPGVQEAAARALREQGYAQGSVKRALGAAKAAVNWAWKEDLIDRQIPFASVSEGRQRERFLSIEELARLWDADMPDHVRAFLALAIGTASRPKALLELKRSQCNLERRVIDLNPSGRTQTKKRRPVLPMAEWLVSWIERSDTYVVEFRGKPVQKLAGAFQTLRDAAGFGPDVTAYTVRHTIATELAFRSVPEMELATTLGHYMPQSRTTGRYIHYAPDYLACTRRALEAIASDIGHLASKPMTPEALRASSVSPLPWPRNENTPKSLITGAGGGIRTLDPNLGKVDVRVSLREMSEAWGTVATASRCRDLDADRGAYITRMGTCQMTAVTPLRSPSSEDQATGDHIADFDRPFGAGRDRLESVAASIWNRRLRSIGIGGRFPSEYAGIHQPGSLPALFLLSL